MIYEDVRSSDLPAGDQFAWWQEVNSKSVMKSALHCDSEADFHVSIRSVYLDSVVVSKMTYSPISYRRNRKMIRQTDPEYLLLGLCLSGQLGMTIDRAEERVAAPGTLLMYNTSHPVHGWSTGPSGGGDPSQLLVQVPRTILPLRTNELDRMAGALLSGREGIGAVTASYLAGLIAHAEQYRAADVPRLSTVTLDLLTALFAHHLDAVATVPSETQRRVLQIRIHEFVERQLGDPRLSPGVLAAAHHISLRQLHKIFHDQGLTAAGWIRQRRLERCRSELADPAQQSKPVHIIARRYGFTSYAHFSRLFTATYGQSPSEYRRVASTGDTTTADPAAATESTVHGSS